VFVHDSFTFFSTCNVLLPAGLYHQTPIDRQAVDQDSLNIANKLRSNPLPWSGQFSPQLVEVLLHRYGVKEGTLLDPFLGSGTALIEAALHEMSAVGAEINPAAIALSNLYRFINIPADERLKYVASVERLLGRAIPERLPFSTTLRGCGADLSETIKAILVDLWRKEEDEHVSVLLQALITLLDFYQPELSSGRVWLTWKKIAHLVRTLPYSRRTVEVLHADARALPWPARSIDTVITSPPYINVFNYHQRYRASMEALSWNVLEVAQSEIGSNRKHRGNRFLTVTQYCLDMALAFVELARVCKRDADVILVIGRESSVRRTRVFNGEIVAEVGTVAAGFTLVRRHERVFQNKFGAEIYEDILHFAPPMSPTPASEAIARARHVAREVLHALIDLAPVDQRPGVFQALSGLSDVSPSPIFQPAAEASRALAITAREVAF
jgi:hypothetical protein